MNVVNGNDGQSESLTLEAMIVFVYFSFTTISTVGFGDYYPVNSFERLAMCSVLVALVASQSLVMNLIISAMNIFISLG